MSVAATSSAAARLVEFLLSLRLDRLPSAVIAEARLRLLDSLGCGLYGATTAWGGIAARVVHAERSQGRATVYGRGEPVAPARAALVNATATHGIEFDDLAPGYVHPGALVIPAVLANTEQYGLSGAKLVLGVVAGYEAVSRIGLGLGEIEDWGFHTSGIAGAAGAAIASGVALGMSHEQIMNALGVACSSAGGLRTFTQGDGGMVKRLHAGRAAEAGVLACALAREGFTAPRNAVEGRFGLLSTYGRDQSEPHALDRNLGEDYVVMKVRTKCYPCYYGGVQAMVQALQALRREHDIRPSDIAKVRVGTNSRGVTLHGEVAPRETMAAQYSMPFTAALALAGDPRDPRSFSGDALDDPTVCQVARKVELYGDPEIDAMEPPRRAAHVEVRLTDGRTLQSKLADAHGRPGDPCTPDEVKDKFRTLAAVSQTPESIARVLSLVERLELLPSIDAVSEALRTGVKTI
ncbi:MAG: MmgE/PrpD family protein [Betaproteobacteria bacterium]|nr:MmgE/PrpD family protein [Betaproteobacteria bacterium]